ncbi:MAG: transporter associated domain-containing protein, partial [Acidimicrobiales bacterium]
SVVREPYFIPEGTTLTVQLLNFQRERRRIGLVVDEYGDIQGMITLEDILEEIVGEIDDEYDGAPTLLTRVEAKGSTVVPASLHPDEVEAATGFEMPEGEFETLAGLVLDRLGHIPEPGEMVELEGWRLEVVAMDRLRIATVRIVAPAEEADS